MSAPDAPPGALGTGKAWLMRSLLQIVYPVTI
jgi:hypothetical protein